MGKIGNITEQSLESLKERHRSLGMNAFDVVLVEAIHEFQSKQTEASIRKLVERTGKADETVRAHLRKLEGYGWLRRVAQYDQKDGARAPNKYDFSALAEELDRRLGRQLTELST